MAVDEEVPGWRREEAHTTVRKLAVDKVEGGEEGVWRDGGKEGVLL